MTQKFGIGEWRITCIANEAFKYVHTPVKTLRDEFALALIAGGKLGSLNRDEIWRQADKILAARDKKESE